VDFHTQRDAALRTWPFQTKAVPIPIVELTKDRPGTKRGDPEHILHHGSAGKSNALPPHVLGHSFESDTEPSLRSGDLLARSHDVQRWQVSAERYGLHVRRSRRQQC